VKELHQTIVIGAGQAGLTTSWQLKQRGLEHVVLERGRVGETWRSRRWDSFRLLVTNRMCQLPGFGYTGDKPDGFMWKDEVVRFFEDYAASFAPPVREGVTVAELRRGLDGDWEVLTAKGGILGAQNVVVATGAYQRPHLPALAAAVEPRITQLHVDGYRNPDQLPDGAVVVVGGGSSGGQVAADLARAGRRVYLALGRCAWLPRRYRGRDITEWNDATGFSAQPVQSLDDPVARLKCLPMLTGSDTGEDMTPRTLRQEGIIVTGRLINVEGRRLCFADDVATTLAAGDAFVLLMKARIDAYIEANALNAPMEESSGGAAADMGEPVRELDLEAAGVTSIVWATGYRMDFGWILDAQFDEQGFPVHQGGITAEPGLYFVGLPWLTTRGSSFIPGVGPDAEKIVAHLAARTFDGHAGPPHGQVANQPLGGLRGAVHGRML
jgi:putative flavoprotein involved in K+ transport